MALSDPDERLIHPDAADPAGEFAGQLKRLMREARAAGVSDTWLAETLTEAVEDHTGEALTDD